MQTELTKAGAEILHRDIKVDVSTISPLPHPPWRRWMSRWWYAANCMEADRSSHATMLASSTTEWTVWQSRLCTCWRYMVSSGTHSTLALVQWRGLMAMHRAGHFRAQSKLRN